MVGLGKAWAAALVATLAAGCGMMDALTAAVTGGGQSADGGVAAAVMPDAAAAPDAGGAPRVRAGGIPQRLLAAPIDAIALAADDGGVYWVSSADELWALPSGATAPRLLATELPRGRAPCPALAPPAPTGSDVLWIGTSQTALHRTHKDGTGDELVAHQLQSAANLSADAARVYWTAALDVSQNSNVIQSLPRDAPAGTPPTTLVSISLSAFSSVASAAGSLYWTQYPNATVYYGTLWIMLPSSVLAGGSYAEQRPYGATAIGSLVALAYYQNLWTSSLAVVNPNDNQLQGIAILPTNEYVTGFATFDGWLLATAGASPGCGSIPSWKLYAAPVGGGALVVLAEGLALPAAMGPAGATYVDGTGQLLALAPDQLRAAFARLQ